MTTAVDLRIDIADLCDQRVERWTSEFDDGLTFPDLWSFDLENGEEWLTDRYWLLPAAVCDLGEDQFAVTPLPDQHVSSARNWVKSLLTAGLSDGPAAFAPTFAGVLTLAGITAYATEGETLYTLVKGLDRIGGLLPLNEPIKRPSISTPIPCSNACVDMYRQITAAHQVESWQAWNLAAHLTHGEDGAA